VATAVGADRGTAIAEDELGREGVPTVEPTLPGYSAPAAERRGAHTRRQEGGWREYRHRRHGWELELAGFALFIWRIKKSSLDRDVLRQAKQGQPTVLVVDDDPVLQDLFQTFLKKIGFSRVVVGAAKDAIKCLRKQKFDLMFLDLQLPDAPGDQVYQTAKQIDPDLNVIVITGYPDREILDRILQVCPVTVLKKPLKIEQLYQTVKILGHSGPSWGSERQSSRLLVGL
jgi:CheY-like chemotaxis protein